MVLDAPVIRRVTAVSTQQLLGIERETKIFRVDVRYCNILLVIRPVFKRGKRSRMYIDIHMQTALSQFHRSITLMGHSRLARERRSQRRAAGR